MAGTLLAAATAATANDGTTGVYVGVGVTVMGAAAIGVCVVSVI